MILVVGPITDSVIGHLTMVMLARNVDFLILDPRNFGSEWDVAWWIENGRVDGYVRRGPDRFALSTISAIWDHMTVLPEDVKRDREWSVRPDHLTPVTALYNTWPGIVVNRPVASSTNGSKPYQQQIIAEQGFEPIRTLITTEPEEARRFYEACNGQVIFKSISWQRSVVRRMTADDLTRLDHLRYCPTQFQEFIAGSDIRVHVVGNRLFATEIEASTDDYRYVGQDGSRSMRGVELPAPIAQKCLNVSRALGLVVSGVDLRRGVDGRYHCFEVNPTPGYIFYERHTRQRIGDAFVEFLVEAEAKA